MDQDATWHGGRSRPRPHCVIWGPSCSPKKGHSPSLFGPCLLWPNGGWSKMQPGNIVRCGPSFTPTGHSSLPQFSHHVCYGQTPVRSNTIWLGHRHTSVPSGILIHPALFAQQTWVQNWAGCAPFFGRGNWVPIQHNVAWAEVYLHAKCHLDPSSCLTTIDLRRKLGEAEPIFRGAGSLSSIMWPEPRAISIPSGILMHTAVWPQ